MEIRWWLNPSVKSETIYWAKSTVRTTWMPVEAVAAEAVAADGGDLIILTEDVMAYIEEDLGDEDIYE